MIPMHYGGIIGSEANAQRLAQLLSGARIGVVVKTKEGTARREGARLAARGAVGASTWLWDNRREPVTDGRAGHHGNDDANC